MEIWKDIIGYEELYQVSNKGRIRSLDRISYHSKYGTWKRKGKILSITNHKIGGYQSVWFPKSKTMFVHRLVAQAFIPNPNNYPIVMHIDNNPANNNVSNLQWGTQTHNMQHASKCGRVRNQYS